MCDFPASLRILSCIEQDLVLLGCECPSFVAMNTHGSLVNWYCWKPLVLPTLFYAKVHAIETFGEKREIEAIKVALASFSS